MIRPASRRLASSLVKGLGNGRIISPILGRTSARRSFANWAPTTYPARGLSSLFDLFENTSVNRPWATSSALQRTSMDMDMKETDQAYEAVFNIPGVDKENIKVSFDDHILTVSVDQKEEKEYEDKETKVHWKERSTGFLSRSVQLPRNTNSEGIQAKIENGVLTITVPKSSKPDSRKLIEIS